MYAIIETGSKQYKVSEGDVIKVEKLNVNPGDDYDFKDILLISDGGKITCGNPYVQNATVTANVMANGKEKKVVVYKYKPKKGFHKKKGHRQHFTQLKITKISF